jgi:hypothetical protein
MAEKSISEQIVDEFIESVAKTEIIDKERLAELKIVLNSDKPKKPYILRVITEKS